MSKLGKEEEQRALDIHKNSTFINICDTTGLKNFSASYIEKLKRAGISSIVVTSFGGRNLSDSIKRANEWDKRCVGLDNVSIVTSVEDIKKAKTDGKIAVILGSQDTEQIERDPKNLNIFHKLGARTMGLTYQRKNSIGDGLGERTNCGLSKLGIHVVEEMNRLHIVVDLSHTGIVSSMEAMDISKYPVTFNHRNVKSLCDNIRNLPDEQIKALAENGGVMGIMALSAFLHNKGTREGSTMENYLDQIDYVTNLVGVNHVGIGLDLGEGSTPEGFLSLRTRFPEFPPLDELKRKGLYSPEELENTKLLAITEGLVARGYSDKDIQKVLGLNALRVFDKVWS